MIHFNKQNEGSAMPNSPENYGLVTYLWVLAISILGGTVRTLTNLTFDMSWQCVLRRWTIDIIVSAFIGVITFYLCEYAKLDQVLTAAFVGISAHMGTRVIVLVEERVYTYLMKKRLPDE